MKSIQVYKRIEIEGVRLGDFIINLGKVLEIDESSDLFSIVVFRRNKKEVYEFEKDAILLIDWSVDGDQ
ncbi:hypothetical protein L0657_05325 [Dyadobacter sp. CY345]|uniref:hypothetical protein n=1 Tax=Dyadobacter sp. CY345 TaxID=2909335 RepID=UPI001F3AF8A1|nr:hypothetical protein [Dyadobacter sp. CY345]MCF2443369.1 hypothetical protein [Dyadobacter sp. CY345]